MPGLLCICINECEPQLQGLVECHVIMENMALKDMKIRKENDNREIENKKKNQDVNYYHFFFIFILLSFFSLLIVCGINAIVFFYLFGTCREMVRMLF